VFILNCANHQCFKIKVDKENGRMFLLTLVKNIHKCINSLKLLLRYFCFVLQKNCHKRTLNFVAFDHVMSNKIKTNCDQLFLIRIIYVILVSCEFLNVFKKSMVPYKILYILYISKI